MNRWRVLCSILLAGNGCEVRGLGEGEPPAPPVVPVEGEPLRGSMTATFEGQPVSRRYGVALPLDAGVELGVVDIRLSVQPVDCNDDVQDGANYLVFIQPPVAALGTYARTPMAIRRFGPGISDRGGAGTLELVQHDSKTVAGRVTFEHSAMTQVSGHFEVTRCPKPAPR
jgi:hypothetical protein